MLRFEEAVDRLLALGAPPLPSETLPLARADGRVLAEDLVAAADLPSFDHSAMDGYAVRASDVQTPNAVLPVVGESRAGRVPEKLRERSAMRIFTGAELPEGADAVVMQEKVTREGDLARFQDPAKIGQFVRKKAADQRAGAVVLTRGTRLRPAHLALAATVDRADLVVARRPLVALLATGDELRLPGTPPVPGTIPEANTFALAAMIERAGAVCRVFPCVRDDHDDATAAFAEALATSDVLVTIGGVSVGDHDVVRPTLEALGVTFDFWKVAIKPGKPLAVGTFVPPSKRRVVTLGIPGNPSSAMVTFTLFGVPLLRAMQGDASPLPRRLPARLTSNVRREPGRLEFARARLESGDGGLRATLLPNQASGAATSMADADALVCLPAEASTLAAGTLVDVLLMSDLGA